LNIHVNLIDLVDFHHPDIPIELYENVVGLVEYKMDTKKYFPRAHAKAVGLLAALLPRTHHHGSYFQDASKEEEQACG
jgi:hypothetical protein